MRVAEYFDAGHFLCNLQVTFSVILPAADQMAGHGSNQSLWNKINAVLGDFVCSVKPKLLFPKASQKLPHALY